MAVILDILPVLRYLPEFLLPIKKEGRDIHRRELSLFRRLYLQAREGLQDGTAKVRKLLNLTGRQTND